MNETKNRVLLPYDLERDIFELTARAFPGHAVKLSTISRYVQEWVESVIYETVVLDLPFSTTKLFLQTFYARPASFFAKNVKRLHLTTVVSFPEAREILAACTGLSSLACWADPLTSQENLIELLSPGRLQRLSIKMDALWGVLSLPSSQQFTPNLFPHLSHLEIVNPPGLYSDVQVDWDGLYSLPNLTHLAFGHLWERNHLDFLPHFEQILSGFPNLKVLLLISNDTGFLDELAESGLQRDSRVVVKEEFNSPVPLAEYWDSIRRGGADFWTSAEKMMLENSQQPTAQVFSRE